MTLTCHDGRLDVGSVRFEAPGGRRDVMVGKELGPGETASVPA